MYTPIRAIVHQDFLTETYHLFSMTLGSIIADGFESVEEACIAAARFRVVVITENDINGIEDTECLDFHTNYLALWVENCDFSCVRKGFNELLYHESCIRKNKASKSDSGVLSACSMSVATSIMLENISNDLGQSFSSDDWLSYANRKLDHMLENGPADVCCDLGCIRLDK